MVGETLNDRYRIERRLGGGSQAEVFLATDVHMERLVAIKIWKPEGGFTVDEFLREAKLLARFVRTQLRHDPRTCGDPRSAAILCPRIPAGGNAAGPFDSADGRRDCPLRPRRVRRLAEGPRRGSRPPRSQTVQHHVGRPRGDGPSGTSFSTSESRRSPTRRNWRQTLADATMAGAGTLLYMSPGAVQRQSDRPAHGHLCIRLSAVHVVGAGGTIRHTRQAVISACSTPF